MESISILGCGWLGERIGQFFIEKGVSVNGSSRNQLRLEQLKKCGINPFVVDIDHCEKILPEFFHSRALIVSTTNKNIFSHQKFIQFLIDNHSKLLLIFTSSTSVYENTEEEISENSPLNLSDLSKIEQLYFNSALETIILRLGGLVGGDRHPGSFFKENRVIKNADAEINLIHERDIIKVIDLLIQDKISNEIFNLVSDEHPKKLDFYTKAYYAVHKKNASFIPMEQESVYKLISNQKIKTKTGVDLKLSNHFSFI